MKAVLWRIASASVSLIVLSGVSRVSLAQPADAFRKLLILSKADLPAAVAQTPGLRHVANYAAMSAIAVPDAAFDTVADRLTETGYEIYEIEDLIRTPRATFSTRGGGRVAAPYNDGLFLVQFEVPPASDWEQIVRGTGVTFVDPLPERSLIVAATASQIQSVARLPWVQYVGPYLPAYKARALGAEGQREFIVQIADTALGRKTLAELEQRVAGFATLTRHEGDVVVRIDADAATAAALLDDPFVVSVHAYVPPGLSDERQAVGITGVTSLTPSTTRYLTWLSARGITPNNLTTDSTGSQIVVDVADTGIDYGCCEDATSTRRHLDLWGRLVRFDGTTNAHLGGSTDCTWADYNSHGTVVASIVGGVPESGKAIDASSTTGYQFQDSDSRGQYYFGLGVAPGVRISSTRIENGAGEIPTEPPAGPAEWTRLAVTRGCNTLADSCANNGLCSATVQTHSHNEYDLTGTYAGYYSPDAREFDFRVRDANDSDDFAGAVNTPLAITVSAGNYHQATNDFTKMVMAPATAKNIISMGAVETSRAPAIWLEPGTTNPATTATIAPVACAPNGDNGTTEADYRYKAGGFNVLAFISRRGTLDGRLKPDLLAPATVVFGAKTTRSSNSFCARAPVPQTGNNWPQYHGGSGTSFAAPVAAGSIALLRYFYEKNYGFRPSPAMYKAMLVSGARSISGQTDRLETFLAGGATRTVSTWPNAQQGFGVIDLTKLLSAGWTRSWSDQQVVLVNGGLFERTVVVGDATKPVQLVLAWTDAPATPGASPVLVNDLDLYVARVAPYFVSYGNYVSTSGYSVTNPTTCPSYNRNCHSDNRNNVEVINLPASLFTDPATRSFTVKVIARILQGVGVPGQSGGASNQDFALFVVNGALQ